MGVLAVTVVVGAFLLIPVLILAVGILVAVAGSAASA
jgi:hypothetical protein